MTVDSSLSPIGHSTDNDEHLTALLSIAARIDGFLYRCRNDPSFTMLYISAGILALSGYPASDLVGNRVRNFSSLIHPDDLLSVYTAVDKALETKSNWNIDYRIVPREGSPIWVHEIGAGVVGETGKLEFLEGFIINNTERKRMEMALQEADTQLQQINVNLHQLLEEKKVALETAEAASNAKSNFLAMMSHELRTPLNAVIGLSDLMGREVHGNLGSEKYREYVVDIHAGGKILLTLIDEILDLTRIEADSYTLEIEPVDVAGIWARIIEPLSMAASVKKIRVTGPKNIERNLALGNANAISKIMTKLVENAIKFTSVAGEVSVEVDEIPVRSEICLVVRDNGIGISPDRIASVMIPFVQATEGYSRCAGSIGLGLAICRLLAEAMKGRMDIESELGQGTTVRLFLPMWAPGESGAF